MNLRTLVLIPVLVCIVQCALGHDHSKNASPSFVENAGQWSSPFLFRADVHGAALFVEADGWSWSKLEASASKRMHDYAELPESEKASLRFNGHAWRMRYVNAAPAIRSQGHDRADHYHNYFLGNDQSKWKGNVGVYGSVLHSGVWPGIDVSLTMVNGNFKYDVLLAPGADVWQVALAYDGLDELALENDGSLRMTTSVGELSELAPVAFYGDERGGPISCAFVLEGNTVRFVFPEGYDATRPVVIDPVLIAATFSGATGAANYGHCAAFDAEGNIYTGARNFGPTYPVTAGAFQTNFGGGGTDISLSKYNPDGSDLIWAAYLGGNDGETPHSLITNSSGELIVLTATSSPDFPITDGALDGTLADQDIAIVHIGADGTYLVGSTFVGGSGSDGTNDMYANYGEPYRGEIFTDALGNIIATSFTSSTDFPVTDGAIQTALGGVQDGVVFKLDPTCSILLASTYIGGSDDDNAMGIRLAANGEIFITGATESSDFPMPTGGYMSAYQGGERDGYILRLSADLTSVIAGSFFGTTASDRPYFLDTDSQGNVWIYGQSEGAISVSPAGTYGSLGGNIFIAKFLSDLTNAPITTMMPGSTVPVAFLVDLCDRIYISGYNTSGEMPMTPNAFYEEGNFYLATFDVDMSGILFGTRYGGSHADGGTSRFDKNGVVYQGVCSGGQSMQTTEWAWAPVNNLGWDIGVFRIDMEQCDINVRVPEPTTDLEPEGLTTWLDADQLWFDVPATHVPGILSIHDATGRIVHQEKARTGRSALSIGHLASGAYHIGVTNGRLRQHGTFVVAP